MTLPSRRNSTMPPWSPKPSPVTVAWRVTVAPTVTGDVTAVRVVVVVAGVTARDWSLERPAR